MDYVRSKLCGQEALLSEGESSRLLTVELYVDACCLLHYFHLLSLFTNIKLLIRELLKLPCILQINHWSLMNKKVTSIISNDISFKNSNVDSYFLPVITKSSINKSERLHKSSQKWSNYNIIVQKTSNLNSYINYLSNDYKQQ